MYKTLKSNQAEEKSHMKILDAIYKHTHKTNSC